MEALLGKVEERRLERRKNEVPGGGQGRWREGRSSKSVNSLPLFSVYSRREGQQPRVWEEEKTGV